MKKQKIFKYSIRVKEQFGKSFRIFESGKCKNKEAFIERIKCARACFNVNAFFSSTCKRVK